MNEVSEISARLIAATIAMDEVTAEGTEAMRVLIKLVRDAPPDDREALRPLRETLESHRRCLLTSCSVTAKFCALLDETQ